MCAAVGRCASAHVAFAEIETNVANKLMPNVAAENRGDVFMTDCFFIFTILCY